MDKEITVPPIVPGVSASCAPDEPSPPVAIPLQAFNLRHNAAPVYAVAAPANGGISLDVLPGPTPVPPTDEQLSRLNEQGFTPGLVKALCDSVSAFPLRIWVVDNSGSMKSADGTRFVQTSKMSEVKTVSCTRWKELQGTIAYHAQLVALLRAPTVFRMLNDPGSRVGPQQFGVADKGPRGSVEDDLRAANAIMDQASPRGVTPLAQHVREIREEVAALAPELLRRGQRVVIILATDGLPTDQTGVSSEYLNRDFVESLRMLESLPVWIIVRLCTNDNHVVEFYNDLDKQLELSLEVLDDYGNEAKEVHSKNPWLNYGLPLHRCREMGFQNRVFDLIEERTLTKDELKDFCLLLFGLDQFDGVPEPAVDMKGFAHAVQTMSEKEQKQWNPVKKKAKHWLSIKKLKNVYGGGGFFF